MSKTIWQPALDRTSPLYRSIADALERDVAGGILAAGSRLPTHRALARLLGVTTLTITRAYGEASRRGLIESTVGRGTFVRAFAPPREVRQGPIDLAHNVLAGSDDLDLPRGVTSELVRLLRAAEYSATAGHPRHRSAGAAWIARAGVQVPPERVIVTPGAQHAVLTILTTLLAPGDVLLCEPFTYPGFRSVAAALRLKLHPVALDDDGIQPKALDKACRATGAKMLYCVPNFQNPTGSVMPEERRRAIAGVAKRRGLTIVEDDVYGFLLASRLPALASILPDQVCYVTSTAKSTSPSLRVGYIAAPEVLVSRLEASLGTTVSFTSTVAAELFTSLVESGEADRLVARKRELVRDRQRIARRVFAGALGATHPASPHAWLHLGEDWTAQDFAHAARSRGVTVAPSTVFAIDRRTAPHAVRISLGATSSTPELEAALRTLAAVAEGEGEPLAAMPVV